MSALEGRAERHPAWNPYLPLYEYVPDGEPRVFGDRLYIYGSHDRAGGDWFCVEDYVVWSAPLSDLDDWRYEGVSYRRDQDPHNTDGRWELFAPDVVQGPDGRFYLYYCLRMQREFGVAVSDRPQGPFAFYGHVTDQEGNIFDQEMPYDPSVLVDEDGRVWLYYGYTGEEIARKLGATVSSGCMVVELASDMKTALGQARVCLPKDKTSAGTGFEGHAYYEAPSMRKIQGRYVLVYSSEVCHELCWAVSDRPDSGFRYGGVIVSNGNIGWKGQREADCLPGNNHGGLVRVNGQFYIFYQRHTHCNQFSRQGCAEPVELLPDGKIPQVEVTSQGLSGKPLPAEGRYPAAIACVLRHRDAHKMTLYREADPRELPYITEDLREPEREKRQQFICNIQDGTLIGYKYFEGRDVKAVTLSVRGKGEGSFTLRLDEGEAGTVIGVGNVKLQEEKAWQQVRIPAAFQGTHALYLTYTGEGSLELFELAFS